MGVESIRLLGLLTHSSIAVGPNGVWITYALSPELGLGQHGKGWRLMTAYLIMASASELEDSTAESFRRAITEAVNFQAGICWVFRNRPAGVRMVAVGYGIPRATRTTTQRVVEVVRLEYLEEPIGLQNLLDRIGELEAPYGGAAWRAEELERLRGAGVDYAGAVTRYQNVFVLKSAVVSLQPGLAEVLAHLQGADERLEVRGPAAPFWRLERDAIVLAVRAAGITTAQAGLDAWHPPNRADEPFSVGLTVPGSPHDPAGREARMAAEDRTREGVTRDRGLGLSLADLTNSSEAAMIEYDSQQFPGWDNDTSQQIRSDIKTFTDGDGRFMEIMSINATPVESRTGVDLLYLRNDLQSVVGVQYKILNQRSYLNPDQRFRDQLRRMRYWTDRFPHKKDSAEDWRLSEDWTYAKLLEAGAMYANPAHILPGHYIALGYAEALLNDPASLGPGGGVQLGPRTAHRHLNNSTFIGLLQRAAIGSPRLQKSEFILMCKIALADLRSIILATDSGPRP
ncbi:hypothetical protein [Actinomadura decatromicini]|uniref:Uncharacterized protein n=1 Tax=Actinomadura decatromicini TaxID=2604572 RepID=A0A5D3F3R3_9ACTN|nr:hypothetical protein [Actinomadura decatromicini]TYK43657.1 hypothetical protein FXF68_36505 [Actinomadura decatromicini]